MGEFCSHNLGMFSLVINKNAIWNSKWGLIFVRPIKASKLLLHYGLRVVVSIYIGTFTVLFATEGIYGGLCA